MSFIIFCIADSFSKLAITYNQKTLRHILLRYFYFGNIRIGIEDSDDIELFILNEFRKSEKAFQLFETKITRFNLI